MWQLWLKFVLVLPIFSGSGVLNILNCLMFLHSYNSIFQNRSAAVFHSGLGVLNILNYLTFFVYSYNSITLYFRVVGRLSFVPGSISVETNAVFVLRR